MSAEWVRGKTQSKHVLSSLADFGTVTFTSCQANFIDKKGAIYDFPSSEVIMDAVIRHNQSVQLVDVSNLNSQGKVYGRIPIRLKPKMLTLFFLPNTLFGNERAIQQRFAQELLRGIISHGTV